jgi:hypothetical protein
MASRSLCNKLYNLRIKNHTTRFYARNNDNICYIITPEKPRKGTIEITGDAMRPLKNDNEKLITQHYTIKHANKQVGRYTLAYYQRLSPFPLLFIGVSEEREDAEFGLYGSFLRYPVRLDTLPLERDRNKFKSPFGAILGIESYSDKELANFKDDPATIALVEKLAAEKEAAVARPH